MSLRLERSGWFLVDIKIEIITTPKSLRLERSGRKQSQGSRRLLPIVAMTTFHNLFDMKFEAETGFLDKSS